MACPEDLEHKAPEVSMKKTFENVRPGGECDSVHSIPDYLPQASSNLERAC